MLSPIILFAYNRPDHVRKTLQALQNNDLAEQSTLFAFCDGPKPTASAALRQKIAAVRAVVRAEQWCGEVKIVERKENLGLARSVINGVAEVLKTHDRIIVLEDDVVTAKGFLQYMNDALNCYANEQKVFGITGHKYPTNRPILPDTYFLPVGSSSSWATWKDRWLRVNMDAQALKHAIDKRNWQKRMNFNNYPYYKLLSDQIAGKVDSWAIRFYASFFLEEAYFLFPNRSLIDNIGFDAAATNTKGYEHFADIQIEAEAIPVDLQPIELKQEILDSIVLQPPRWKRVLNKWKSKLVL